MTIAQIAYIASLYDTPIAEKTFKAAQRKAMGKGPFEHRRMMREFMRYEAMGREAAMRSMLHA